jgi:hypothetical protein
MSALNIDIIEEDAEYIDVGTEAQPTQLFPSQPIIISKPFRTQTSYVPNTQNTASTLFIPPKKKEEVIEIIPTDRLKPRANLENPKASQFTIKTLQSSLKPKGRNRIQKRKRYSIDSNASIASIATAYSTTSRSSRVNLDEVMIQCVACKRGLV